MSTSPINPYRPPTATVTDVREPGADLLFRTPGAQVDAGRGASWVGEGWALFKLAPLMWIVAMLILFAISFVIGLVPLLGNLASVLLGPVFVVGVLAFAHGLASGEEPDVGKLFIGFKEKLGALVGVGALYLAMLIVVFVIAGVLAFAVIGSSAFSSSDPEQVLSSLMAGSAGLGLLLIVLVFLALLVLVAAAYWYAPGLVFYTELGAVDAFKESFAATFRNWLPLLVYGIVGLLVMLLGALALGIGLFVAFPVLMASYYAGFRDVFGQK